MRNISIKILGETKLLVVPAPSPQEKLISVLLMHVSR